MKLEDIVATPQYKEGWDEYEYKNRTGNWKTNGSHGINPYGNTPNDQTWDAAALWLAGANSAYGTHMWRKIVPKGVAPKLRLVQVQLRLFEL